MNTLCEPILISNILIPWPHETEPYITPSLWGTSPLPRLYRITWVEWHTAWQQKTKVLKALFKDNTARTLSKLNFNVYFSSVFELYLLPSETKLTLNKFHSVLLETAGWTFPQASCQNYAFSFLRHDIFHPLSHTRSLGNQGRWWCEHKSPRISFCSKLLRGRCEDSKHLKCNVPKKPVWTWATSVA